MPKKIEHFERTDVTWKPAVQIKAGDKIYGPGRRVSRLARVLSVQKDVNFRIVFELEGDGTFTTYRSVSVATPKE